MSLESRHPRWARVLRFPLTRILVGALFVVPPMIAVRLLGQALDVDGRISELASALVAWVCYVAYVRVIERRPVVELSAPGAVAEASVGLIIGAALFAGTMLVLWLLGVASIGPGHGWSALVVGLAPAFGAALSEEIVLRGLVFRILAERLGDPVALGISAALFGFLHAFNPGATAVSSIAIALEAGVLLAAAFMVTRRLWMAIGLHMAWNFTEGSVFGASVSGHEARGLFSSRFDGADLLSGGAFGPEASVVAVILCLTAAVVLIAIARRRSSQVPRPA
ncbi:MAG TPA: type II CAAX endopeptidase family protein [Kofleriaceae bacterium]|nr:type II CAAX endopeptidase family protein [Kofleriaceae bacterium]